MRLNDPILIDYPVRIRIVLLSIVIILPILFYTKPRFLGEASAQEAAEDFVIETIDIPPPEDIVEQKPNRPAIPEPVDDDTDDEDIEEFEDTDFNQFDDDFEEDRGTKKLIAFDEPPKAISPIKLKYPAMAKAAGIEGTVLVEFFINKKGKVSEVKIIRGTGTVLDGAAVDAVKKSTWKPARQRTKKVGVWMEQSLKFYLD
jgi:protein TonB